MPSVQFVRHIPSTPDRPDEWHPILTHTHTYSGRADHGGVIKPPESYERLSAWTRQLGIAALGMGSAYTPATARQYDRFDGEGRREYYAPRFDQLSVRGDEEIAAMLDEINQFSAGSTFFYLDNETPKGRFGHMWWVGYVLDYPAWHDFDQDFDRWMLHESRDDSDEPMPYERRPYREVIASQRAQGAVGNWAHPTSWWTGSHGQFITNIASEMPAHLIADGFLDGMVVMGYRAFRPEYQNLWFSFLDRGYRIPGVAEMDVGLSDEPLWRKPKAYVTLINSSQRPQTAGDVAQAWKSGQLIASCGAWVSIEVDEVLMGGVARTGPTITHQVSLRFGGEGARYDVELIGRGGEVLWTGQNLAAGTLQLNTEGLNERGYLLARVFGLQEDGTARDLETTATSNPVYLHPPGQGFEDAATTEVSLEISLTSRWRGGVVHFETANGESLGSAVLNSGNVIEQMPAGGRVTLESTDGARETHYLINANRELQDVQRYLYRGRFLRDWPEVKPGQVPPKVWRFDKYLEAMQTVTLNF